MTDKQKSVLADVRDLLHELKLKLRAPLQGEFHGRIESAVAAIEELAGDQAAAAAAEATPHKANKKH